MPRAKRPAASVAGPSDDDLAAFRSAMAPLISQVGPPPLPSGAWARLTALVIAKGYTLVVSPTLGGQAYKIALPMGEKRVEVYVQDTANGEKIVDQLLLAVQALPSRQ